MITRSNNTNKFNPQELIDSIKNLVQVQIIQINSILKNWHRLRSILENVQIIQINSILKNKMRIEISSFLVQIIQINSILKNEY